MSEEKHLQLIFTGYQELTTIETPFQKSVECDFVILCNPTTLLDTTNTPIAPDANSSFKTLVGKDVRWGTGKVCVNQLFVGETTPFLIPVKNLNQIQVYAFAPGVKQIVSYSCFKKL